MLYTGIFAIPTLLIALYRTLDGLAWLSVLSVFCILVAGVVGMVGAGLNPTLPQDYSITVKTDFVTVGIFLVEAVSKKVMLIPNLTTGLHQRYQPSLRVCWSLYVLHFNIRNALT